MTAANLIVRQMWAPEPVWAWGFLATVEQEARDQ